MDLIAVEVLARALEFLWEWTERSRMRLVCKKWDRAFTVLLENTLSRQRSPEGEWTPQGPYCTKHTLCHLHRMPLEVLASLTAIDWRRSYLGAGINQAILLLVDERGGQLPLTRLNFEGSLGLKDEPLVHLATAHGGSVGKAVQSLNLSRCPVVTSVGVDALARLQQLTELNLAHCSKSAGTAIATTLSNLPLLTSLTLAFSDGVTDVALAAVANAATALRCLDISSCQAVTDAGVQELTKSRNLRELRLSNCLKLTDGCASTIVGFSGLQNLQMAWCPCVTRDFINVLCQSASLTALDFSKTKLDDAGVSQLAKLSNLTDLNLSWCEFFTESGFLAAVGGGRLAQLKILQLTRCCGITDLCLQQIASLPSLRSLDLTGCTNITDGGVQQLRFARELRTLLVGDLRLTDAAFVDLATLRALEDFKIPGCSALEDRTLLALAKIGTLQTVNVTECSKITDLGLSALARGCPRLTFLDLSRCDRLTDVGLLEVCQLRQLRQLKADGCNKITDVAALPILKACSLLETLGLARCCKITDAIGPPIAKLCRLASLDLSRTAITDVTLKHLAEAESLTNLDLSVCELVTDVGVGQLERLWGLESLSLDSCRRLTDVSVTKVARIPALQVLNVFGCDRVTPETLVAMEATSIWVIA